MGPRLTCRFSDRLFSPCRLSRYQEAKPLREILIQLDDPANLEEHHGGNDASTPDSNMPAPNVPKPGPAVLSQRAGLPEWLEEAKQCHYLPETVMKQLCEMVKECLMEGEFC